MACSKPSLPVASLRSICTSRLPPETGTPSPSLARSWMSEASGLGGALRGAQVLRSDLTLGDQTVAGVRDDHAPQMLRTTPMDRCPHGLDQPARARTEEIGRV